MQLGADHGENSQCRMFTVIDPWHRRESAIPENCRKFLPRDAVLARYMSVIVCLSVRPSVTSLHRAKTAKHKIT